MVKLIIILISAVLLSPLDVNADVLILKSGKVFEGEVVEEKKNAYVIKIEGGTVTFNKTQVESIIYDEPSEEQIKKIKGKGYVKYEGKWITQDEHNSLVMVENIRQSEEIRRKKKGRQERQIIESVKYKNATIKEKSEFSYPECYKKALGNYRHLNMSPSVSLCQETERQAQFAFEYSLPDKDKKLMAEIIKECRNLEKGLWESTMLIKQYFKHWQLRAPSSYNEMYNFLSDALIFRERISKDNFEILIEPLHLESFKILKEEIKTRKSNEIKVSYIVAVYQKSSKYGLEKLIHNPENFTENIEVINEDDRWKINSLRIFSHR
ncbi:MAG: hypothetical protein KJ661_05830 [Candidatus Omnitrophica bacterium]|nr:hypothetical protein [Candidatus Omnitrophota bacterium]